MKLSQSIRHAAFVTAFILTAGLFLPGISLAQHDMKDMPEMAPKKSKKPAVPATPKPADAAATDPDMKDMPGMDAPKPKTPAGPATPKPAGAATTVPDMKDMPGMDAPKPKTPAAPATPKPAGAAATDPDMKDMPGMAPATDSASKPADAASAQAEMDAMPGMAPKKPGAPASSKKGDMAGMPGMTGGGAAKKGGMAAMPGMAAGAAATEPMSAPGIRILGPSQKWVPPRGDNRAAELLPRSMLEAHMKHLPEPVEDSMIHNFLRFELLEYRAYDSGPATLTWDFVGWTGGDYNRLWVKTEGEWRTSGERGGEAEAQLLYGRMIAPFWDFQAGVRYDLFSGAGFDRSRGFAVIGLQGLAPYRFEFEPALFISQDGDLSARLTASYDMLLTQRLVLQPRLELDAALQSAEKFGVGEGFNSVGLGLRLRYEITREFAPYIGVHWLRRFGETADISRRGGGDVDELAFVVGVRLSF